MAEWTDQMTNDELLCATALDTWKQVIKRATNKISSLTDDQLRIAVAPGRNRVIYLLGHLTVANDRMSPLLRIGERKHPELDAAFFDNPDRAVEHSFSPEALRVAWDEVNRTLLEAMSQLTPAQWLERHASVSEEDFVREPLRNRLAILLSRTNHASFHFGQIILATEKA